MTTGKPDIGSLVPHRLPARLVEAVEETAADRIVCRARVPASNPFASGEVVPAFVGLELGAQAAAALEALARFEIQGSGSTRIGYLVGVRDAVFHAPGLPVGIPLRVSARLAGRTGPLSVYEVVVSSEGVTCVEATISTTIP